MLLFVPVVMLAVGVLSLSLGLGFPKTVDDVLGSATFTLMSSGFGFFFRAPAAFRLLALGSLLLGIALTVGSVRRLLAERRGMGEG